MHFGVTFYPDQWPVEYWDKAFTEIKLAGFDVVRFGEMAWDWIEPREGWFDFGGLDKALSLCQKHGLKVILGSAIAQAPQWLISRHQKMRPVAHDGALHPEYGPRPNACRDNHVFRKHACRVVDKLARRYANHPALFMWQIDNEPCYPPLDLTENKDWCHCEATRKAFVEWAKQKYKTLDALNKAWGTKFWVETFAHFNEIKTPKAGFWDAGNPHIYLDWYRFKSERISDWLMLLKRTIRKHDKLHKIGTNSFTSIPSRIPDHAVIAKDLDWFGWDIYPMGTQNSDESLAQIAEYWRGVCEENKAEFWVMELQVGPNVRWGYSGKVSGADIKRWTELLIEHGAQGIMYFNWRPPLFGSETGGFGLLNPDGTTTGRLEAVKEIIKETKNQRKSSIEGGDSPPKADRLQKNNIAIYYSKSSEIQTFQEEGFPRRGEIGLFMGLNAIAGAYRLVNPGQVDFIFDLESPRLKKCRTLLLTNPYLVSKKQFEALKGFLESGGTVISDSRLGLKDEMAHLYPRPPIENLVKFSYLGTEIIETPMEISKLKAYAMGFRDLVKLEKGQGKALANFADKAPALIEFKVGKGRLIYATFSLFPSLLDWRNGKLIGLIREKGLS